MLCNKKAVAGMALLSHENFFRTYVLKGEVVAEYYPNPNHGNSSDFDCFLSLLKGDYNVWSLGNDLNILNGIEVATDFLGKYISSSRIGG